MKFITTSMKLVLAILAVLVVILNVSVVFAQSSTPDIGSIISSLFSNPYSLLIFVIELVLGLALGFFSVKAIKYILALICIFIVGVLLNVWATPNLGTSIQKQLSSLGLTWSSLHPVIMSIVYLLGLTTVLPITVGFIIGIVIATVK
jgi:hypothetical protein